jgi:hypothetical protein
MEDVANGLGSDFLRLWWQGQEEGGKWKYATAVHQYLENECGL